MSSDVVILGAGLAGLSAARDLVAAGTDAIVLEARGRAGGRVEQTALPDGRLVQLGGEVVGSFHTSYSRLVAELGLRLEPSFPGLPGQTTYVLADGHQVGDDLAWMSGADRASYTRAEEAFRHLARGIDPDDPWSHPDAERLDRASVGTWLRSVGATPNAVRVRELAMLALGAESVERTSLLADLRKEAAADADGFYNYDVWESQRVTDPWTRGYITAWRPGDVTAVGPLHGTHEPPFYVCGSDQWVCGYMEGAVRTGRAAAAAALTRG